jgi:hypothetical protein
MAPRIVDSQALFESQSRIINWRDHDLIAFDRHADTLIDTQARFPCHRGRQANTQIIPPLFDIQHGFGHDGPPRPMYKQ